MLFINLWESFPALFYSLITFCICLVEIDLESRDTLLMELEKIERAIPPIRPQQTEWAHRKEALEENWCAVRNELYSTFLFTKCIPPTDISCTLCRENLAVIRCSECRALLCSECDKDEHIRFPFHDKEVWINGYFEPVGNCMTVINGEIQIKGSICLCSFCHFVSFISLAVHIYCL